MLLKLLLGNILERLTEAAKDKSADRVYKTLSLREESLGSLGRSVFFPKLQKLASLQQIGTFLNKLDLWILNNTCGYQIGQREEVCAR